MSIKILAALILIFGLSAHAETQLVCWNIKSHGNSRPLVTAQIGEQNELSHIKFDYTQAYFSSYNTDRSTPGYTQKSELFQPRDPLSVTPSLIDSNHSPYKGDNEYLVTIGKYEYVRKNFNHSGTYVARWILPTQLANRYLKNFRIRSTTERSNSLIIVPPPALSGQGGDSSLRLFCVSR